MCVSMRACTSIINPPGLRNRQGEAPLERGYGVGVYIQSVLPSLSVCVWYILMSTE